MSHYIEIDDSSGIPKYKQVINSIKKGIADKHLKLGDKIHSINHLSNTYKISRETVKKAYSTLRSENIINSVKGKGFYIMKTDLAIHSEVLFLCSELSKYERELFVSLIEASKEFNASIMLKLYHYDVEKLKSALKQNLHKFDKIVLIPHFKDVKGKLLKNIEELQKIDKEISPQKVIILDKNINKFLPDAISFYHDYDDFGRLLSIISERTNTYKRVVIVSPMQATFPHQEELILGLEKYCKKNNLDFQILFKTMDRSPLITQSLYMTLDENGTIQLLSRIKSAGLILGKDLGLISLDDALYKELLGISVVKRNYNKLGFLAANMIFKKNKKPIKNVLEYVDRKSA